MYEPHFEDIKRWRWSRVTDISKNFKANDCNFVLNSREFVTLVGFGPEKAEALVNSFRKIERKQEDEDSINMLVVIVACIFLSEGMHHMVSTRIDAIFDLFDFFATGNVSLDTLNIMLICVAKALAAILQKDYKLEAQQHILDYTHNIFEALERNLYDDQETISKQEFHDYAKEAWEGLEEPELIYLFGLFSSENEDDEQEGEREDVEIKTSNAIEEMDKEGEEKENIAVDSRENPDGNSDQKSHARAAHAYANLNKEAITAVQQAAKKYNETINIAVKAKDRFLSSSVDYDLDSTSQKSLILKLKSYQLMELALDKLHTANSDFTNWLSHHKEQGAPAQLLLALHKYHDDRLKDMDEVERVFKEAKGDGVTIENLKLLDTMDPKEIQNVSGSLSSVDDNASTGSTLSRIVNDSKELRPKTRESEYTDASGVSYSDEGSEFSHTESEGTDENN